MTVWIKEGVCGDLRPEMRRAKLKLIMLYHRDLMDFFITCVRDGNHTAGSCHYEGDAMDFKRQGVTRAAIVKELGPGYDVVEYDYPRDIFHVEWDPK